MIILAVTLSRGPYLRTCPPGNDHISPPNGKAGKSSTQRWCRVVENMGQFPGGYTIYTRRQLAAHSQKKLRCLNQNVLVCFGLMICIVVICLKSCLDVLITFLNEVIQYSSCCCCCCCCGRYFCDQINKEWNTSAARTQHSKNSCRVDGIYTQHFISLRP